MILLLLPLQPGFVLCADIIVACRPGKVNRKLMSGKNRLK
jgi:hypothetical protein